MNDCALDRLDTKEFLELLEQLNEQIRKEEEEATMGKPWALDTFEKLHEAGYRYVEPAPCASSTCDKVVFWFITPNGHCMPFERFGPEGKYQPHFATCPDARKFSRKITGEISERKEPEKKGVA